MPETHLELKLGAPVEALDGAFGHMRQVILSPLDRRVVALIIRHGSLPPRATCTGNRSTRSGCDTWRGSPRHGT